MVERERIRNMSLSRDARTGLVQFDITEPFEGQVVDIIGDAEFPVEVLRVKRRRESGGMCELLFETDATVLRFDDSNSDGSIDVASATYVQSEPTTGDEFVDIDQTFTMTIQNLDSVPPTGLKIQITLRRTDENVFQTS